MKKRYKIKQQSIYNSLMHNGICFTKEFSSPIEELDMKDIPALLQNNLISLGVIEEVPKVIFNVKKENEILIEDKKNTKEIVEKEIEEKKIKKEKKVKEIKEVEDNEKEDTKDV